jgi:hypothetical protein
MIKIIRGAAAGAILICTGLFLQACPSVTSVTPATACSAVASAEANPTFQQQISTVSPTSAVGVLWAYVQSGCVNGRPVAGVSATWEQEVVTMLENALPDVLPALIGLI